MILIRNPVTSSCRVGARVVGGCIVGGWVGGTVGARMLGIVGARVGARAELTEVGRLVLVTQSHLDRQAGT